MKFAATQDGVSIAWESQGGGAPLILVHGVTQDHRLWGPIADALAERFRVIVLDLRGHGASGSATDYSPFAMTRDVGAVVEAAGVERPAVIGHSLGGLVATAYASDHPVDAVINVDLSLDTRPIAARLRTLEAGLRGPGYIATLRTMFAALAGNRLPARRERPSTNTRHGHPRKSCSVCTGSCFAVRTRSSCASLRS